MSLRFPAMPFLTLCLMIAAPLLFGACQSAPERPPALILENGHSGGSVLATSPDSRWVAAGDWRGWVRLWALEDGAAGSHWRAHTGSVNGLFFLPDEAGVLTAGYDGMMALWTVRGQLVRKWSTGAPVTAFDAGSRTGHVLTGHAEGSIRLWRTDGTLLETWERVHGGHVRAVAMDSSDSAFAAAGTDGQVTFWRTGDAPPRRLEPPPSDARALLFDPGGGTLLGAGWFELFRWELPGGKLQRIDTAHRGIINDLALLPDRRLASISRQTDSAVLLLDPRSGETLERLQRHDLCGAAVAPSPDGRFLATTSDDATVRIWRLEPSPAGSLTR